MEDIKTLSECNCSCNCYDCCDCEIESTNEFVKLKFIYEVQFDSGTKEYVEIEFNEPDAALHISEMLFQFDKFLKACGFGDCYKLIDKTQG